MAAAFALAFAGCAGVARGPSDDWLVAALLIQAQADRMAGPRVVPQSTITSCRPDGAGGWTCLEW